MEFVSYSTNIKDLLDVKLYEILNRIESTSEIDKANMGNYFINEKIFLENFAPKIGNKSVKEFLVANDKLKKLEMDFVVSNYKDRYNKELFTAVDNKVNNLSVNCIDDLDGIYLKITGDFLYKFFNLKNKYSSQQLKMLLKVYNHIITFKYDTNKTSTDYIDGKLKLPNFYEYKSYTIGDDYFDSSEEYAKRDAERELSRYLVYIKMTLDFLQNNNYEYSCSIQPSEKINVDDVDLGLAVSMEYDHNIFKDIVEFIDTPEFTELLDKDYKFLWQKIGSNFVPIKCFKIVVDINN